MRIGIHAGEPIEDSNDLFGATVQMATRICQEAAANAVAISKAAIDGLSRNGQFPARELGPRVLKGIPEPVSLYEIAWR